MPDFEDKIPISEFSYTNTLHNTDQAPIIQQDGADWDNFRTSIADIGLHINKDMEYVTDLHTTSKKIIGAINELADGGSSMDIMTKIDTPASVQTFSDGGDNIPMKSCEVAIVAQQASGTPSPLNPLPITGFDNIKIGVARKNLWLYGGINTTRSISLQVLIPIGTYMFSGIWTSTDTDSTQCRIIFYYNDGTQALDTRVNRTTRQSFALTATKPISSIVFYASSTGTSSEGDTFTVSDIQLEEGSTATAYEAPQVTPVSLGQTIYGGTAEIVGGNGVKKFDISDLGDLSWSYDSTNKRFVALLTGAKLNGSSRAYTNPNSKCTDYEVIFTDKKYTYNEMISGISSKNNVIWLYTASGESYVNIKDTAYTDAPTFKTAMTGVKFVYELETPTAFTFTGANIQTLSGVNNVYADSGDVNALEYFNDKADDIASMVRLMTRT